MGEAIKRVFDIVFGVLLGIIAIPLLIIACLFIYVCSPEASPIFRQVRVGYHEKEFTMLKLRTMTNKRGNDGQLLPDEERLKWWGKLIRKTNIDELTQIIHILAGQMSFIGPRPLLPREMLVMTPKERQLRQSVLPGIVGWESVNEDKSSSRAEMAQYDLYYVRNWSLSLDTKIFFMTIKNVLSLNRPEDSLRAPKLMEEEILAASQKEMREIIHEESL